MAVGDAHGLGVRLEVESVATSEGSRDEVAGGAAVDEHHGWARSKGAGELDEDSGGGGKLVDLLRGDLDGREDGRTGFGMNRGKWV